MATQKTTKQAEKKVATATHPAETPEARARRLEARRKLIMRSWKVAADKAKKAKR